MISSLCEATRERWQELGLTSEPPLTGTVLGADKTGAKLAVLLLDGSGHPCAVAKVSRDARAEASLKAEDQALVAVGGTVTAELAEQIPRSLGVHRIHDRLVLLQTARPGAPMTRRYFAPGHVSRRSAVTADLDVAFAWLQELHSATLRVGEGHEPTAWAAEVVEGYRRSVGWSGLEAELFDSALDRLGQLPQSVPLTVVHGDYWMGNLLLDKRGQVTGVVDWEAARTSGLPLLDAYKLVTSYGFYLDRSRPWGRGKVPGHPGREDPSRRWRQYGDWPNLLGFGHVWFGSGWLPDLAREHIEDLTSRLGLDARWHGALFPLFLAEQALFTSDPVFREGYRTLVSAFAHEKEHGWLWQA